MRFRAKSLTSLLFAFLLALPMISVISKVIYVQSNKNAYESYYGETINEKITLNPSEELKPNIEYTISPNNNLPSSSLGYIYDLEITSYENITTSSFVNNVDDIYRFRILKNGDNYFLQFYYNDTNNYLTIRDNGVWGTFIINFNVRNKQQIMSDYSNFISYSAYNKYSYLDNVFEYAVDEVITDNNFGNIDFFSFFTSIFMSDNQVNNRYIGYVNYYLNYALMVSLAYLLFLMLMWFINFARRFLDRGMNYDW